MSEFSKYAASWWMPQDALWTLHALHALRCSLLEPKSFWHDKRVLDVGCGGGLFAEEMYSLGSHVHAFDESEDLIHEAKKHLKENFSHSHINYYVGDACDESCYEKGAYDAVFAFEVIEHVSDPDLMLANIMSSLKVGGVLMLSAPNRTAWGYIFGIFIPEYILSWLPVGTHRYHQLVSLQVLLKNLIENNFQILDVKGISYYPMKKAFDWCYNTDVHYTIVARKKA